MFFKYFLELINKLIGCGSANKTVKFSQNNEENLISSFKYYNHVPDHREIEEKNRKLRYIENYMRKVFLLEKNEYLDFTDKYTNEHTNRLGKRKEFRGSRIEYIEYISRDRKFMKSDQYLTFVR